MSNTDRMSLLERWADGMEKLEQYYEGKYGPPATPAQLPAITTYYGMLEAIADGLQRAKRNINKKSPTYHSDSVAYVKTVPSGDVHYASLEQIGGKTVVWNQLVQNGDFVDSTGWTFGKGTGAIADNVATVTCGSSGSRTSAQTPISFTSGHKYYLACDIQSDTANDFWLSVAGSTTTANSYKYTITTVDTWNHVAGIITPDVSLSVYYIMATRITGSVFKVRRVKVNDLTSMFGSGNEPSTVAEFQQTFPAVWYAYNPGSLLSAGVTEVVSKKADATTLATYAIPAEVQALEGYGLSAGSLYNYVDFEAKKFVQNVGSRSYTAGDESDSTVVTDMTTTYYPLTTAVETDISEYLTDDDNIIEVEAGGTLTFPNSNGDNYRIPVPSSETFVVGEP